MPGIAPALETDALRSGLEMKLAHTSPTSRSVIRNGGPAIVDHLDAERASPVASCMVTSVSELAAIRARCAFIANAAGQIGTWWVLLGEAGAIELSEVDGCGRGCGAEGDGSDAGR